MGSVQSSQAMTTTSLIRDHRRAAQLNLASLDQIHPGIIRVVWLQSPLDLH